MGKAVGDPFLCVPIADAQIQANITSYQDYWLTTISRSLILHLQSHPPHYGQNGFPKMKIKQLTFTLSTMAKLTTTPPQAGPACLSPSFTPHSCSSKSNHVYAHHTGPLGLPSSPQLVLNILDLAVTQLWVWLWALLLPSSVTVRDFDSWASVCKVGMVLESASQQLWELNNECTTHVKFLVCSKCEHIYLFLLFFFFFFNFKT